MKRRKTQMKKRTIIALALFSAGALITLALAAEAIKETVNYPEGYRQWHHVQSLVIAKGHKDFAIAGGIHNVYANDKAFEALTEGKPYPDGAVFVNDVLTANEKDHAITEGPRRFIGVMQKESKEAADTGGWAFETFEDDTKERKSPDQQFCFQCHKSRKDTDYVLSEYRK